VLFLADYVEILRRYGDEAGFSPALGLQLGIMRAPFLLETVLPFAFLFGALLSLLGLSRKLELVVARASGVSAWGFLAAPFGLALLLGAASSLLFNPLAVQLNERAKAIQAELTDPARQRGTGLWFRQDSVDGASIVHATQTGENGMMLYGVTAFVFGADGVFHEKVVAPRAHYENGEWVLSEARISSAAMAPQTVEQYLLPTNLSAGEVLQTTTQPEGLSIWSLPAFIDTAGRTGLNTDRFTLAFHTLLARPLFLLAMVTIAATVSLRLSRQGGTWRLVLTGVGAGFLLYVLTEIVSDLGGNGIIDPVLAAWAPSIIALTFGATALFHQEDG
jgi:lipopolysaccharide export system permease protein